MKKIQVVLAVVTVLAAGAGVFANARVFFATTYYRAADADFGLTGARCGVQITSSPCPDISGTQCFASFNTQLPSEAFPTVKTYYISKMVNNGPCVIVKRNF